MLSFQRILVALVAIAAFLLMPGEESSAVPGAGGLPLFSVNAIGPAWDITPAPSPFGPATCVAADILTAAGAGPAGPCGARVLPAPPGPVPDGMSAAPGDLGLDLVGGPFTDDLDGLSYGEALGVTPVADFDFSVDAAPPVGVTTAAGLSCGVGPSDVTIEAAALQAQGDIFTTAGTPPGCNTQFTDELALGLIAPNPGFPPAPPLDDMDALTEFPFAPGACTLVGGFFPTSCAAFSVDAASAVLGAPIAPDACFLLFGDAASILVPPGTPPILPCMPLGCPPPGGIPCNAVSSAALGLVPADDLDALCWFDADGDLLPDLPNSFIPGAGDYYLFSLTPGSPTLYPPALPTS